MKWVVITVVLLGMVSVALAKPTLEGLLQELSKIELSEHHPMKRNLAGCDECGYDEIGTTDTNTICVYLKTYKNCDLETLRFACNYTCGDCTCPGTSSTKRGAAAAETNLKDLLKTLLKAAEKTEDNELERLQREQEMADDEYVADNLYRLARGHTFVCGTCEDELGFKQVGHVGMCAQANACTSNYAHKCKATCHQNNPECVCDYATVKEVNAASKRNLGEAEMKRKLLAGFNDMLKNL